MAVPSINGSPPAPPQRVVESPSSPTLQLSQSQESQDSLGGDGLVPQAHPAPGTPRIFTPWEQWMQLQAFQQAQAQLAPGQFRVLPFRMPSIDESQREDEPMSPWQNSQRFSQHFFGEDFQTQNSAQVVPQSPIQNLSDSQT